MWAHDFGLIATINDTSKQFGHHKVVDFFFGQRVKSSISKPMFKLLLVVDV